MILVHVVEQRSVSSLCWHAAGWGAMPPVSRLRPIPRAKE